MKHAIRLAVVFVVVFIHLPLAAESAGLLYKKGRIAETRQNYEQAFEFYQQAFDKNPRDVSYRSAYERLRFLAGASHVHRGQLLREAGRLEEAMTEFEKGVDIDPSSAIAKQEIKVTEEMVEAANAPERPTSASPPTGGLEKRVQEAAGPVELAPIPPVRMAMKQTEDTKIIYETIGKLAGINVLFDPEYQSRRIKVDLNSISLEEALRIVAMASSTFWRPITPNTIFVAQDNPAKRKQVEQSVMKTFYLSNLSQPSELQDVVNVMRQILEIVRIQPLQNEGAIVLRGSPDQIALAGKLVDDLDRAKPEVIIDVAVLQISKDKTKTLGISPPTSMTVTLQPNINTANSTSTTPSTATTTAGTNTGTITLNALGNLNANDFQVAISQANVSALFADNNTKLIQNPQIRALDGQKASLKIGERLPVAQGSFQPGIGGVGINPLVNTQFTYQDVGVNIDVTPTIHPNGDVTLKTLMDISTQVGSSNIGGITQPIIGQRKIEHTIRLREGEANLLGGMLEDSQTKNLTGIPGLAQIPLLKYLFGQSVVDHSQTETVFVLIPHIVRREVLTTMNQETIDVGTANAIQLPRVSPAAPSSNTPNATGPGPSSGAGPVNMAQVAQAASATGPTPELIDRPSQASFAFDPSSTTQRVGSSFTVNVALNGGQNVFQVPMQISYDPKLLEVANVSDGNLLSQDGQIVTITHRENDGNIQVTATRPPGAAGVSGQGSVVTLTLIAKATGQARLTISQGGARDPAMQLLPVGGASATVTIQ